MPDRKTRRPVTLHRHPADILQQTFGAHDVLHESRLAEFVGAFMAVTMAGQLVALTDYFLNQLRVALGNPAQCEKRRPGIFQCQQSKNPLNIAFNSTFNTVPFIAPYIWRHRRDLKIVLDVDRQRVDKPACVDAHLGPSSAGFLTALTNC